MTLIPCRATINLVGASAGSTVLVDPDDPQVALHMEKGYLVTVESAAAVEPVAELELGGAESGDGASGEGDADEELGAGTAVGDDAEASLETIGDSVDELAPPAA